jgi:hypothetical protein
MRSLDARLADRIAQRRRRRPGITDGDRSDEGRGRVALITGASAGIGHAYAELLAAKGYRVVLVARRGQRLKEIQVDLQQRWDVDVNVVACDLTRPNAVSTLMDGLADLDVGVDYLVNNAGFIVPGPFHEQPWSSHHECVHALAVVPSELCHRLLPHMVDSGWGRIVNITSVAALYAGSPLMAVYGPAKAFLLKLSETLAEEYRGSGVQVTASVPGVTDTEFFAANHMAELGSGLRAQLPMMRAETVARQAHEACDRGKRVVVHGGHHKALMFVAVHSPPRLRYALVRATVERGVTFD